MLEGRLTSTHKQQLHLQVGKHSDGIDGVFSAHAVILFLFPASPKTKTTYTNRADIGLQSEQRRLRLAD